MPDLVELAGQIGMAAVIAVVLSRVLLALAALLVSVVSLGLDTGRRRHARAVVALLLTPLHKPAMRSSHIPSEPAGARTQQSLDVS